MQAHASITFRIKIMQKIVNSLLWVVLIINAIALIVTLLEMWPGNPLNEHRILLVISFIAFSGLLRKMKSKKNS